MSNQNPAIANTIQAGRYKVNYHDVGQGEPLLLIHGSGPGVTAFANWGKIIPVLSKNRRVIAPDMLGFGYSERPAAGIRYTMDLWVQEALDLLDALKLDKVDVVGNSFGGALALALAIKAPHRIRKVVLMGAMGVKFPITYGLDQVWGYQGTAEHMSHILKLFAYDRSLITDDIAQSRYTASMQPGFQESFSAMFPFPRQESVKMMASKEEDIKNIKHSCLIIHGKDDLVIPVDNSYRLFSLLQNSQLHIFSKCGHWTQIEHAAEFCAVVEGFLEHA